MSSRSRSTTGCWTCRLRRKKCDEQSPACSVCTSLALTCHGYGPRPQWMDGQARESWMAENIRRVVKETASQKRRAAMLRRNQDSAPSTSMSMAENGSGIVHQRSPSPKSEDSVELSVHLTYTDSSARPSTYTANDSSLNLSPSQSSSQSSSLAYSDDDEASLLMHYLDHVFLLQFPFYKPSIQEGGRGWLLSILMQTKPLYYAALSLAAYHLQSIRCPSVYYAESNCRGAAKVQEQHVLAIRGLRKHLEAIGGSARNRSLVDNIEMLCCMVLLISLEVFIHRTDSWRVHLRAAAILVDDLRTDAMQQSRRTLSPSYSSALHFFAGVMAWYDILSCVTTGVKSFCHCALGCLAMGDGFIQLDKVMGCQNWAMLCIMEIATLDEWRREEQERGRLSVRELVSRAADIERELEGGLDGMVRASSESSDFSTPNSQDPVYLITRAFASAALVYIHVVASGPYPKLPEIRKAVTRTLAALQAFPDQHVVAALFWPLCIAGAMALDEDEDFFRNQVTQGPVCGPRFGNSSKVSAVLEECWKVRREENGTRTIEWREAMERVGVDVLLV
ncbi:uncharacterized protein BDZ99DRAFT_285148 [Mytilinidion resinicola]|uniref:Zn(2)-C6 fungal-type domain-containing protein n=1 Tax=Mytilinidion resinicola TaxID=574789 RepID=A0A6A6YSV5_9PEZI|nr:uncharacterized protein BDZ99DRAFT_285148 [Mytilinidion resinicola]KAF2812002.1 hypothetical protein BDZ99DRAFT_285148 [Mytilinidion resinicola]